MNNSNTSNPIQPTSPINSSLSGTAQSQPVIQTSATNELPWQTRTSNQIEQPVYNDPVTPVTPIAQETQATPITPMTPISSPSPKVEEPIDEPIKIEEPVIESNNPSGYNLDDVGNTIVTPTDIPASIASSTIVNENLEKPIINSQTIEQLPSQLPSSEIKFTPLAETTPVFTTPVATAKPIESMNQLPPIGNITPVIEAEKVIPVIEKVTTPEMTDMAAKQASEVANITKPTPLNTPITSPISTFKNGNAIVDVEVEDRKHRLNSILLLIGVIVLGIMSLALGIFLAVNGSK